MHEKKRDFARVDSSLYFAYKIIDEEPLDWTRTATVYLTKNYVNLTTHTENMEFEDMFRLLYAALGEINDEIQSQSSCQLFRYKYC